MKRINRTLLTLLAALGITCAASATIIVNQTNWPDGGSAVQRTNQNFPDSMGWNCGTAAQYQGSGGQLHVTNNTGSLTFYGYFADSNSPVSLGVGQKLRLQTDLVFTTVAASNANRGLRFAILYSGALQVPLTNGGTIRNDNLTGYGQSMNFGVSWGIDGPLQAFADTNSVDGNAVISKNTQLDSNLGPNLGGNFGDPGFADGNTNTLIMTIARTDVSTVQFTTTWLGPTLTNGGITMSVVDTNYAYTNFDTFVFRPNAAGTTCAQEAMLDFKVELLPIVPPAPNFTSAVRQSGSAVMTWNATPGYSYTVLTNANARTPTAQWSPMITGYPLGDAMSSTLTITNPITTGNLLFRLSSP